MPDFITLTCPTCGGKLQIIDKISTFACGHCGNEHIVHREGGMIYLAPLAEDVRHIRTGVDKTAAELAIVRLTKELAELSNRIAATRAQNFTDSVELTPVMKHLPQAMFGTFLFVVLGANAQSTVLAVVMVLALIAEIIWYAILRGNRVREGEEIKQATLRQLETEYEAKSDALERNRGLVEG